MLHTTRYVAWLLMSLFCLLSNNMFAVSDEDAFSYVERYKDIAVQERIRTGIPASITLAQGLYESGIGVSELATIANNHFGIKCKSTWKGETHFVKDDDYDANGKLIKSCFRKYNSVEESYRDHSDFLVNNDRYNELFLYADSDYKAWAKGLKRCGYATNPKYAEKLIDLIDRYALYQYDYEEPTQELIVEQELTKPEVAPQSVDGNYNPGVEIVANDPNVPEAYSVADYMRNSYAHIEPTIQPTTTTAQEKEEVIVSRNYWKQAPVQHTNLAQNRIAESPVSSPQEILSAPMYDIEYYELTEKGPPSQEYQKQENKQVSSSGTDTQYRPRKRQFKRRGR